MQMLLPQIWGRFAAPTYFLPCDFFSAYAIAELSAPLDPVSSPPARMPGFRTAGVVSAHFQATPRVFHGSRSMVSQCRRLGRVSLQNFTKRQRAAQRLFLFERNQGHWFPSKAATPLCFIFLGWAASSGLPPVLSRFWLWPPAAKRGRMGHQRRVSSSDATHAATSKDLS